MATQRDWNVDEPVRKLEKLSLAANKPSPREQLEGALGTDHTESEIEEALSSRGPLPEQLLSGRVWAWRSFRVHLVMSAYMCLLAAARSCPRSY